MIFRIVQNSNYIEYIITLKLSVYFTKLMKEREKNKDDGRAGKSCFHLKDPLVSEFSKLKVSDNITKKLRQESSKVVLYEFKKPKAGYYAMKGCKFIVKNIKDDSKQNNYEEEKPKLGILTNFVKKYALIRSKYTEQNEQKDNQLPEIRIKNVNINPVVSGQDHSRSTNLVHFLGEKSMGLQKQKKRQNKSCRNILDKKFLCKINLSPKKSSENSEMLYKAQSCEIQLKRNSKNYIHSIVNFSFSASSEKEQ